MAASPDDVALSLQQGVMAIAAGSGSFLPLLQQLTAFICLLKSSDELYKDIGGYYSNQNYTSIYTALQRITETPVLAGRKY